MSFYDAFKDVINIAQKADNIELYKQLLDLSSQALDLQAENTRLREENETLKKRKINEERIVRHKNPYVTLSDDELGLKYCAICWDGDQQLIQMREMQEWTTDSYTSIFCHRCKNRCRID